MSQPVAHYAALGAYNNVNQGSLKQPYTVQGTVNDIRIIPEFGSCGNNILSHGLGNREMNNGYFSLCSAYPNCPGSCTKYVAPLCPDKSQYNNRTSLAAQMLNNRTTKSTKLKEQSLDEQIKEEKQKQKETVAEEKEEAKGKISEDLNFFSYNFQVI